MNEFMHLNTMKKPSVVVVVGLMATLALLILYTYQTFDELNYEFYLQIIVYLISIALLLTIASMNINWSNLINSSIFKIFAIAVILIISITIAYNIIYPDVYNVYYAVGSEFIIANCLFQGLVNYLGVRR